MSEKEPKYVSDPFKTDESKIIWKEIDRFETTIFSDYELESRKRNLRVIAVIGKLLPKEKQSLVSVMNLCIVKNSRNNEWILDNFVNAGMLAKNGDMITVTDKLSEYVKNVLQSISDYEKRKEKLKK